MNEKGRPEDFLYNGTFSQQKMPRSLLPPTHSCCFRLDIAGARRGPFGSEFRRLSPSISLPGSQSPFTGSEPEGKATAEVLQLSFQEAIDRGLRNNLGLLLSGDQTIMARGERWKELSNLLPNLSARVQEDVQTLSLTALGFKGNLFPFPTAFPA